MPLSHLISQPLQFAELEHDEELLFEELELELGGPLPELELELDGGALEELELEEPLELEVELLDAVNVKALGAVA